MDIVIDDHGRPEPLAAADEVTSVLGFLDYQRATLAWKCEGLETAEMQTKVGVSSMTLGGLLKHMAYVEDSWFSTWLWANEPSPPWDTVDWTADRDWEWNTAATDTPDDLRSMWNDSVERSRSLVAEALALGGFDQLSRKTWPTGDAPSLRWIALHMIEEYARHNGHADLLREAVDGQTGE